DRARYREVRPRRTARRESKCRDVVIGAGLLDSAAVQVATGESATTCRHRRTRPRPRVHLHRGREPRDALDPVARLLDRAAPADGCPRPLDDRLQRDTDHGRPSPRARLAVRPRLAGRALMHIVGALLAILAFAPLGAGVLLLAGAWRLAAGV